jgi:hypothetical protein
MPRVLLVQLTLHTRYPLPLPLVLLRPRLWLELLLSAQAGEPDRE